MTMSGPGSGAGSIQEQSIDLATPNHLFRLPKELRDAVYKLLLTGYDKQRPTFGPGSGIDITIVMLNNTICSEALSFLYKNPHKVSLHDGPGNRKPRHISDRYEYIRGRCPPGHALRRMHDLSIDLNFATTNRGEAEVGIDHASHWTDMLLYIGLAVLHNPSLDTFTLSLWNVNQRKVGAKRVRTPEVKKQMRDILRPFAYLTPQVRVSILGFDTIEYHEMFEDMRSELAGKEVPVDVMMQNAIRSFKVVDPRKLTSVSGRSRVVNPSQAPNASSLQGAWSV